tara:strand:+ start:194 stop:493 length:300 start_codon:yes stop_codon:yes gene_type:complete
MKTFLMFMNFLDFMFFPLMIATIIAVIIEQLIRRFADSDPQSYDDARAIRISMNVRKFIYQQFWIVNVLWFLSFFIFTFIAGRNPPPDMMGDPNLLWKL